MARDLKAQQVALDAAVASHGKVEELRVVTPLGTASVACKVPNDPQVVVEAAEHYMRWLNDGMRLPDMDEVKPDVVVDAQIVAFSGKVFSTYIDNAGAHVDIVLDRDSALPYTGACIDAYEVDR